MTASSYGPTGMVRWSTTGRAELACASIASSHRLRRLFWVNRKGSAGERGTIALTRGASSSLGSSSRGIVLPTQNGRRSASLGSRRGSPRLVLVEPGVVHERGEVLVELLGDLQRDGDDHHPVEPDARHGDVEQLADHVVPERFVPGSKRALPVGMLDQGVDDLGPEVGADRVEVVGSAWRSGGPPGGSRPPGARLPRRGSRGTRGGRPACRGVGRLSPDRRGSGASCRG